MFLVHYFNVPLTLSCNCSEAMGGTVYIPKFEKVELIDERIHQERSLENNWKTRHEGWPVDFLSSVDFKRKHDFSEIYDDYHIVFEGALHEYSLDRRQIKTSINFTGKDFSKWTNRSYHLGMVKIRITILPWYTQKMSVSIKSIVHSLNSLRWNFESHNYQSFREK